MKQVSHCLRWSFGLWMSVAVGCAGSVEGDHELQQASGSSHQELDDDDSRDPDRPCGPGETGDSCDPLLEFTWPEQGAVYTWPTGGTWNLVAEPNSWGSFNRIVVQLERPSGEHVETLYDGKPEFDGVVWHSWEGEFGWTPVVPGQSYSLKAYAHKGGEVLESEPVAISVPKLAIKAQRTNTYAGNPALRRVRLSVSNTNSKAKRVEFFRDGKKVGEDTQYPFEIVIDGSRFASRAHAKVTLDQKSHLTNTISLPIGNECPCED